MTQKHTLEPWPHFVTWCEPSSPHPGSEGIVRLGFEDYRRARACVNACVGVTNGELAMTAMSVVLARMNETERQRDHLQAQVDELLEELTITLGSLKEICSVRKISWPESTIRRAESAITKITGETK